MIYQYTAFDKTGRSVTNQIDATTDAEARESLRRQGYFVTDLRVADSAAGGSGASSAPAYKKKMRYGARLKNVTTFARQLHVLVASGTPLVQAVAAVERQVDEPGWKFILQSVHKHVEEGMSLSEALRAHPEAFDAVCRSLVAAGETSGQMVKMLDRLADLCRKQLHLRSTIIGAMVYPTVLIMIGVIVMNMMLLFVLPRFAGLFSSLDTPLPPTTKMLMAMSGFLQHDWYVVIGVVAGTIFATLFWWKHLGGRAIFAAAILKIPKLDKLVRSLMSARLARLLGTLLESHVPLMESLQLTREAAVHAHYVKLIERAEDVVTRGQPISAVLCESDLISPSVQEAIRNAEQSGDLGGPLVQMADFLDEENEIIIKSMTSLLEPAILIVLGGLVALMAISMFLPLFDLVSAAHGGG